MPLYPNGWPGRITDPSPAYKGRPPSNGTKVGRPSNTPAVTIAAEEHFQAENTENDPTQLPQHPEDNRDNAGADDRRIGGKLKQKVEDLKDDAEDDREKHSPALMLSMALMVSFC